MRSVTWLLKKQTETRMKANMNHGGFSVLETQIVDWRSRWTPAVSSAASCLILRSQLIWPTYCQPRFQDLSLRVNSWTPLDCGCIYRFIKTTSVCKSRSASLDLTWESTRYLPAPSAAPPVTPSNLQTEEIRAKCDYLMTLETISSKLKGTQMCPLSNADLSSEITECFHMQRGNAGIFAFGMIRREHMQGISWRRNFHGVWQQQDRSRLYTISGIFLKYARKKKGTRINLSCNNMCSLRM